MNFVYLRPDSNWFIVENLHKNDDLFPYDCDTLKNEITNQLSNRYEYMDVFKTKFCFNVNSSEVKEQLDFYIDDNKLALMATFMDDEKIHPMITFHGTSKETIELILNNGYIIPGTNKNVKIVHGAVYGPGIYSSPFYDKARYYAAKDKESFMYIIVNLLFPGKIKLISDIPDSKEKIPFNGVFKDNIHTKIVYGLDQIICADPKRVISVAVITLSINKSN